MASAIAVPELVYASSSIVAQNGNPSVMMNLLMLAYFVLILGVVWLFGRIPTGPFFALSPPTATSS